MIDYIKAIISTSTFHQSAVTTSSTILNGILGILFYIFLARELGPASFGVFSVAVLTLTLVSDISNVGTDTGIVNFVGRHFASQRSKALKFLKLGLKIKVAVGIFLVILSLVAAYPVAVYLLMKPELTTPLRLALIGAFGALLFSFVTSSIQAVQKFWAWGILNISLNLLRLVVILILAFSGILTEDSSLVAYIVFPFIGFFVGLMLLPKFINVKNENEVLSEFFHYNKWIAVFTVMAAISARLDTYLVARALSLREVGIYSVAVSLSAVVPQIVFAIAAVAAPKFAGFENKSKAWGYAKKLQFFTLGLAALGLAVGIPLAYIAIPLLYGSEYSASIVPFIILLISQAIFLISVPAHTVVIYYFSHPKLFVFISFVDLVVMVVLGSVLISNFGYVGAAVTSLVGSVVNLTIPFIWSVKRFKRE